MNFCWISAGGLHSRPIGHLIGTKIGPVANGQIAHMADATGPLLCYAGRTTLDKSAQSGTLDIAEDRLTSI
jgi:hypothetical protein